ncbi:MAG: SDR family oxidoreductase [Acidobacteria bacterium]|nr:SDR family oxidoreductase [Acidobacteriota bacterium]
MVEKKIYLVTGGAGFIGSHIAEALVKRGDRVRVFDNLMTGKLSNLAQIAGKIDFIEGDIRDFQAIRRALTDVQVVFHEAAIPSVPRSIKEPQLNHDVNVNGTFNLLLAAHEAGVRRVIFAASSSAYGEIGTGAKQEEQLPDPLSPYAVAKLVGEYYCRVFTRVFQLETVALRYFNVFGPRQDPTSPYSGVISKFMTALLDGQPPVIFGDGEQSRDFTYVANVVDANLRAAEAPEAPGKLINLGVGARTTLNQLLAQIQKIAGTDLKPKYEPSRAGDVRHSLADIKRAESILGYLPAVDLAGGLRYTLDWYRENR